MAAFSYLDGSRHTRWDLARVDHPADLGRLARVEVDVALADGRLLGQQAGLQQRLPHLLGERAVVAGEAAREVGELGVVAAPLAHAVEPLEDPAGRALAGIRVLVRAGDRAARAEQRRARASSSSSCGAGGAGRRAARRPRRSAAGGGRRSARAAATSSITPGGSASARARRRSTGAPARRRRASTSSGSRPAAGIGEDEEAAGQLAGAQLQVVGAERRAGLGELDQRADDGRDEQPLALGQRRRDRRAARRRRGGGEQRCRRAAAIATWTGSSLAGARLGELGAAVAQRLGEHLAQARGGRRGRCGPATGVELDLQGGHFSTVPAWLRPAAEWSLTGMCRASSSATRRAGRPSAAAWPAGRATRADGTVEAVFEGRRRRSRRWSTFVRGGPGHAAVSRVDVRRGGARGPLGLRHR